jgi:hypothetical protein
MSELLRRVVKIVRSYVSPSLGFPTDPPDEEPYSKAYTSQEKTRQKNRAPSSTQTSRNPYPGVPQQVIDDLAVFGLTPPSSLADVRAARNKEIKKYHSDKFVNEPELAEFPVLVVQLGNEGLNTLLRPRGCIWCLLLRWSMLDCLLGLVALRRLSRLSLHVCMLLRDLAGVAPLRGWLTDRLSVLSDGNLP